ncbi:TolC family protein [Bdellovibrio bacteriovorus]|uniref:Transporter n=1 Tax=Bdellovibrio bacteriovorus TaxID=959 RepID=A0A1Z3NAW0_BDEBC|nr:TolC family protein [Bdellovibrio bacteriovorus]ASD64618.1 transporter [Bdellovibrio bacteriovorus]
MLRKTSLSIVCLSAVLSSGAYSATLQEAYQSALQKNETVGIQNEQVQQIRERVKQVRGGMFPQISANATYFMQPAPSDPVARQFFPERQTTVALTANQVLFRGLREFAAVRQQKDLVQSQEEIRNQALIQLYQDVTSSYLNILTLEQDLDNISVQLKIYDERVKELSSRVRRGESSSSDALTAQSSQAALNAEHEIITGNLKMAREAFAFLTGLPTTEPLTDPELAKSVKVAPLQSYLDRIESRYDVKAARSQYQAMEEEVSIAKGAHWPSLDLTGNYYFKRPDGYSEDLNWDVQLKLTVPLFEGGTTQSRVREAASKRIEADLLLSRLRRQADQEIRAYYENFQTRLKQVEALEKAGDLSERNYKVLQKDYRRGLARNIDVQVALTDFRIAARALDQARFAAQMELVKLKVASAEIEAPKVKED